MTTHELQHRSRRCRAVAQCFGLSGASAKPLPTAQPDAAGLIPRPGQVTLITGPSGAGKSTLLRAIRGACPPTITWIDLDAQRLPRRALIDCFPRLDAAAAMRQLSRVGLAEAPLALRLPSQLSDGQRWRLRLALCLHRARAMSTERSMLISDEFGSLLDRVTAMVIARSLRRLVAPPLGALLATSHDDLASALRPDTIIRCDFAGVISSRTCDPPAEG